MTWRKARFRLFRYNSGYDRIAPTFPRLVGQRFPFPGGPRPREPGSPSAIAGSARATTSPSDSLPCTNISEDGLGTFASALKRERPNSGGMMHTCSAGCGPSSFTKRNGRAFFTVISCIGGLTLDKLPAPPTVGGAFGIAVTGRGLMWRTRIRGSLPSGLHLTTSGALRTLQ
jgi:hypothetical protein